MIVLNTGCDTCGAASGEAKVVSEHEVDTWTMLGWRLVAMVQESMVVKDYIYDSQTGHNTEVANVVSVTKYVLQRSEESTLAAAADALAAEKAKAKELESGLSALKRGHADAVDMAERLKANLDITQKVAETRRREAEELREQLGKMEADMAKAREHFGKKGWSEALGGE